MQLELNQARPGGIRSKQPWPEKAKLLGLSILLQMLTQIDLTTLSLAQGPQSRPAGTRGKEQGHRKKIFALMPTAAFP